jgi:Periplasmic binding protein domain
LGGFERGIRGTRLRVVARVNADYDRTTAEIAADRILRSHPHLSGFFAANDLMALGIADSVGAAGKTGKVKIIGLDGIAEALDAIQAGSISATVSQYPYVMGQMAVEACAAAARGARLPARVDAPIALLTKDNVAHAIAAFPLPIQGLLRPVRPPPPHPGMTDLLVVAQLSEPIAACDGGGATNAGEAQDDPVGSRADRHDEVLYGVPGGKTIGGPSGWGPAGPAGQ